MANISDWVVVGIGKFASKKDSSKIFYTVNCTRDNDSLVRGGTEVCRKIVSARGFGHGIDVGSSVCFFGANKDNEFVASVSLADSVADDDDLPF